MTTARTVVIVYPNNIVHTPTEVPLVRLRDRGHRIVLWTTAPHGELHRHYVALGMDAHSVEQRPWPGAGRYAFYARELGRFLAQHPADVIFSHLQSTNASAVLARVTGLSRTRTIVFRHNASALHLASPELQARARSRNTRLIDRFLNRFAEHIVTPGRAVRDLVIREGADASRVSVIPYAYDFDRMGRAVDAARVAELRSAFPARLRMIAVMRFVPMKRHHLTIETLAELLRRGHDVNLTLLDQGPELEDIKLLAQRAGVSERVQFVGFTREVLAHLAAADLVLCPSLEDASNSAIKEAGLVRRPVVVVRGVGDFDDYIEDGRNGFTAVAGAFVSRAVEAAEGLLDGSVAAADMGRRLEEAVRARFTIGDAIVDKYEALTRVPIIGV